jgi:hypothetical protein
VTIPRVTEEECLVPIAVDAMIALLGARLRLKSKPVSRDALNRI